MRGRAQQSATVEGQREAARRGRAPGGAAQSAGAPHTKGGPDDVDDRLAGVDVGDELRLALRGVSALAKQHDLRLHAAVASSASALHLAS